MGNIIGKKKVIKNNQSHSRKNSKTGRMVRLTTRSKKGSKRSKRSKKSKRSKRSRKFGKMSSKNERIKLLKMAIKRNGIMGHLWKNPKTGRMVRLTSSDMPYINKNYLNKKKSKRSSKRKHRRSKK